MLLLSILQKPALRVFAKLDKTNHEAVSLRRRATKQVWLLVSSALRCSSSQIFKRLSDPRFENLQKTIRTGVIVPEFLIWF